MANIRSLSVVVFLLGSIALLSFPATSLNQDFGSVTESRCVEAIVIPPTSTGCSAYVCVSSVTSVDGAATDDGLCRSFSVTSHTMTFIVKLVGGPELSGPGDSWDLSANTRVGMVKTDCMPTVHGDLTHTHLNENICTRQVNVLDSVQVNEFAYGSATNLLSGSAGVYGTIKLYAGCDYQNDAVCRPSL